MAFSVSYVPPPPVVQDCRNTSYSSIVAHEYAHYVLNKLGLEFRYFFGEGFADSYAIMYLDDPIYGREIEPGRNERETLVADCQYGVPVEPYCQCAWHLRGQVLSGVWARIAIAFKAHYSSNPAFGLEVARQLHVKWMLSTSGGNSQVCESALPITATEILLADDDDADLSNGTPHCALIVGALDAHSVEVPTALNCP